MTMLPKCGAGKRQGPGTCARPAGWGTDHPGWGPCKLHGGGTTNHRKSAARQKAKHAAARYGIPREVMPEAWFLEEIARGAGIIDWLGAQIDILPEPVRDDGSHPMVEEHLRQRRHLREVCRDAIHAGVAERQVAVAEQHGAQVAAVIRAILGDMELTPAQLALVPRVVPRHLRAITG